MGGRRFVDPGGLSSRRWPFVGLSCVFCPGQIVGNEAVWIIVACSRNAFPGSTNYFDFFAKGTHKLS